MYWLLDLVKYNSFATVTVLWHCCKTVATLLWHYMTVNSGIFFFGIEYLMWIVVKNSRKNPGKNSVKKFRKNQEKCQKKFYKKLWKFFLWKIFLKNFWKRSGKISRKNFWKKSKKKFQIILQKIYITLLSQCCYTVATLS